MTATMAAALIALIGAATAYIKAHTENSSIRHEREETRKERNSEINMLEYRIGQCEKRCDTVDLKLDKILDELTAIRETIAGMGSKR